MFASDKEIILTITTSALLMIFLIIIIVIAVVKYQSKLQRHLQEIADMKIIFQEEIHKIQSEIEEQTFQRISEEIHDNIGQILSLAKVNLNTIRIESDHPAIKHINTINDLVSKAIQDLRQLSKSLNSAQLSQYRLFECIKMELDLIGKTGIYSTKIEEHGSELIIDPKKQLIIFRMVQEIFNNIIKHAKAKNISVKLEYSPKTIILTINDDGVGFDVLKWAHLKLNETGTGIYNLYRRSKLLGAEINIDSQPKNGTRIQLLIPY